MGTPFPIQLLPFKSIDGPDNQYGQVYVPIKQDSYIEASGRGFYPYLPYVKLPSIKALVVT